MEFVNCSLTAAISIKRWWWGLCGQMSHGAMMAVMKLLVGPPMPDWSMMKTQTKEQSSRSSRIAGGWT